MYFKMCIRDRFRMAQNHNAVNWERYRHLLSFCPPLVDCGVHYNDVAQWFTGSKIVQVSGISTNIDGDVPDGSYNYSMMNAVLADGTVFNYESGWSRNMMANNLKEFIGDSGYIKLILSCDRKMCIRDRDYMDAGQLVPDDIVIDVLKERIVQDDCQNGFILDGFPRSIPQAQALEKMGVKIDKVISIEVEDDEIIRRITGRRVCSACGTSYHIIDNLSLIHICKQLGQFI